MQDEVLAAHRQEVDAELMALQTTGAQGARDTLTAAAQAAVADVTAAKNRARAAERRGQKLRDLEIADPDLGPDVAACAELANALQDRISPLQDLQALDEATPSERFTGTQLIEQARAAVDTATTDLGELEGRFGALEVQYQTTINLATTYPNLQLTEPVVNAATGRPGLHPAQNLARLNTLIAGADIWEWTLTAVPQSRRRVGLPNSLMMPNITIPVQNVDPDIGAGGVLNLQIGPEIIMDWLYPNPAHGKSYQDLVTLVKNVLDRTTRIYKMFPSTLQAAQGTNQEISSPNYGFRLILNQTLDMIITYFSTV